MWRFRVMARGEINQDPVQDDYFNTAALDSYSDALVREAIQNSLDAKRKNSDSPVRVRITFPENSDLPRSEDTAPFFENIRRHIDATDVISNPPDFDGHVPFLVFEDFGTRGLVGDPELADDPEPGVLADFFYFWRNIGRGKKEGDERGRWGLGKTMFPASSRIHAFFGLTLRDGDEQCLLMGQSTLSIHHIDGQKHYPYGYFGEHAEDQFTLPIIDQERIDDFCTVFSISRESESGLSVVIPYPREEISSEGVLTSVITHYFFPILSGDLIVEVQANGELVSLDENSISTIVEEIFTENDQVLAGTLALAKWYISIPSEQITVARQQEAQRSPSWEADLFTAEKIEEFAEALDSRQPVCVRIPVHVIPTGNQPKASYFDIVLERDSELDQPLDEFIRSGITISGVSSLRESGIRVLVIANDLPIATMLGDAENPAHTEWQDRSRNFVGKYRVGKSTLAFVKDAPRGFLRLLNRHSEEIDDTALRHLFPDPSSKGGRPAGELGSSLRPGTKRKPRTSIDVQSRPRIFKLSKVADGFTASLTEEGQKQVPMPLSVRMAYDVRKGNPYKRWVEADFDLEKNQEQLTVSGGDVLSVAGNRLEILATSPDWKLQLKGFDPDRDLIVDLRRERQDAETV